MLRRCLDSPNPCFGMIPPPRAAPSAGAHGGTSTGNDYGTMLEIRNVQMLPDGRSVVETWGTWRFRIMERGMRDGYMVARVERIEDYEEELDESAVAPPRTAEDRLEPRRQPGDGDSDDAGSRPARDGAGEFAAASAEAAVRAQIGDAFVQPASGAPSASGDAARTATSAPAPASVVGRSDASVPAAIAPSPSASGAAEDRSGAHPAHKALHAHAHGPTPASPAPRRAPTNAELMAKCHAFIEQTRRGTPWVVQHLHNNFVPMPTDPVAFAFWMAIVSRVPLRVSASCSPCLSCAAASY